MVPSCLFIYTSSRPAPGAGRAMVMLMHALTSPASRMRKRPRILSKSRSGGPMASCMCSSVWLYVM